MPRATTCSRAASSAWTTSAYRPLLPVGGILEQSDATGWMGFYAIVMRAMAVILNRFGRQRSQDLTLKFLEHIAAISDALDRLGLWG